MKFVNPEFLYALFAIAIPVIIHLFNFRKYKKIYFSNVQFLKDIQQETQSKSKLKHLLILLSRILAITFLVFAFAQPFIPTNDNYANQQKQIVSLYLDNSFSMESKGKNGNLLNEAKQKAVEIVKAYPATTKFIFTNNNFHPGDQRILTSQETIDKIEATTISTITRQLSACYSRNRDILNSSNLNNKSLYLISDFQKSTTDFNAIKNDTIITSFLIKLNPFEVNNLYIDSCWFNNPTHLMLQNELLFVQIVNNSNNDLTNIPLKLFINNQNVVPTTFSIKANDKTVVELNYLNKSFGKQEGKIMLRDDEVTMDDTFYFSYEITKTLNVMSIFEEELPKPLSSIFNGDSLFNYTQYAIKQLDYSSVKKQNFIILHELKEINSGLSNTLKSFIKNGGSLYVIPNDEMNLESYTEFLSLLSVNYFTNKDTSSTKVSSINLNHSIYANVFESKPKENLNLPVVAQHYRISKGTVNFKSDVLTLKNGDPFIASYKVGKGTVYLGSTSLTPESSNFSKHAIFVPTIYNMSLLSQPKFPLFYVIGDNASLELNRNEKDVIFHLKKDDFSVIPQVRNSNSLSTVFVGNIVEEAGNYTLESNKVNIGLAFNYNRSESDLSAYHREEIQELLSLSNFNASIIQVQNKNIKVALNELNVGVTYWKYCIILALFFFAVEILLIKILN